MNNSPILVLREGGEKKMQIIGQREKEERMCCCLYMYRYARTSDS